jgi:exodeoxyribonuclease V gamma subunit
VLEIPAVAQSDAENILKNLVLAWYAGLQAPLPIACNTAIAWLEAEPENALTAAQKQYEGDEWNNGEVNYDYYLTRFYPSFASLNLEQGEFVDWIQRLYKSVYMHIR